MDWIQSYIKHTFNFTPSVLTRLDVGGRDTNRPFPPTFAICRNCQKLRYWVGFVGVLSVNAGER